jgi:hypothetical protein
MYIIICIDIEVSLVASFATFVSCLANISTDMEVKDVRTSSGAQFVFRHVSCVSIHSSSRTLTAPGVN